MGGDAVAADSCPSDRGPTSHERFQALVGWLSSEEALGLPLSEVEKRLEVEGAALLHQLSAERGPERR